MADRADNGSKSIPFEELLQLASDGAVSALWGDPDDLEAELPDLDDCFELSHLTGDQREQFNKALSESIDWSPVPTDGQLKRARLLLKTQTPSGPSPPRAPKQIPKQKPQTPEPGVWGQERWQLAVSNDSRITGGCLGVALLISTKARRVDGTRAMISNDRIAQAFAIDKSTVKRHTKLLRDLGYLQLTHKGHRRGDGLPSANVYDLCLPDSQGLTHEP